ncbi:MAG: DNA-processing protein DprA [Chitinophagaceae bacterium]|nr:DNA-processing protein DprA [Chitinophagaceae bacterium]
MFANDLLYQISLTHVNGIGPIQSRILLEHFNTAENIFKASKKALSAIEGIGEIKANLIKSFNDFKIAEAEIKFIEKHHIEPLFLSDKNYPQKLLNCYDAPTLLYFKGNANLNQQKSISIIGTRNNTEYGKKITEKLVEDLKEYSVTIYSGLAFGIDAIAHKAALKHNLPTIGVLAHGFNSIYPQQHQSLAKEMVLNGGLLTEFSNNVKADKHNFPRRNRIVAGISDATIVIETDVKGGSMITAELAFNYNKDVFAIPGRITDSKSSGCLKLIHQNKAALVSSAQQIVELLGWVTPPKKKQTQRMLFIDLSKDELKIVEILKQKEQVGIDEIQLKSQLSSSAIAAALLNLELQNIITSLPGKMYQLN